MMLTFEKFRFRAFSRRAYYDIFNAGMLFMLAFMVIYGFFPEMFTAGGKGEREGLNVVSMMTSPYLLAAMGMMMAYRYGAVDLSIWAVMGLGGLIAAELLNFGYSPYIAFIAATLAGVVIGWINYLLVRNIHISSAIITFLVGVVIIVLLYVCYDVKEVAVTNEAFDSLVNDVMWVLNVKPESEMQPVAPMMTMRMLIVFSGWASVLIVLLIGDMMTVKMPRPFARWWVRPAALITSGGLCGLAGACWLLEHGSTPVPTRPVDSLYIPAVVVLSGTIFLTGRGRTLLVSICLPTAMLVVLLWNQVTWPYSVFGFSLEMLTLMIMVGMIQWTFVWAMDYPIGKAWIGWLSLAVCIIGLSVIAFTPTLKSGGVFSARSIYFMGLGIWAVGAVVMAASAYVLYKHRSKTDYD